MTTLFIMKNELPEDERALCILKKKGAQCVKALADEMAITVEGARFHLMKLAKDGLVKSESIAEGRGRPKKMWSLKKEGHERFPDAHAELTVNLIKRMRESLGEEAVEQVIGQHEQATRSRYSDEIEDADSLEARVAKLAEIRTREGYMAEYKKENGEFLFIENHCPICSAAKICQRFCRAELNVFQSVLGNDVQVERTEHIIAGARRCAYKISQN